MVWRLLEHWTVGDGGWVDTELIWTLGWCGDFLNIGPFGEGGWVVTELIWTLGCVCGLSLLRVLNWTRRLDLKLGHGDCGVWEVKDIARPVGWTLFLFF